MDNLYQFLTQLTMDPLRQDEFARDPVAVMTRAGLDADAQALLTAGDIDSLQQSLTDGNWNRCACASDPGYDIPPPDTFWPDISPQT